MLSTKEFKGSVLQHSTKEYFLLCIAFGRGYGAYGRAARLRSIGYAVSLVDDTFMASYRFRGDLGAAKAQLAGDIRIAAYHNRPFTDWHEIATVNLD